MRFGDSFVDLTRINHELEIAMATSPLREEVRTRAEDRPGIYRWLGGDGRILYVGKSVRLRSRLLSYFREETGKAARMVAQAGSVNWDYTPNEFAAVVREMRLIRAWQPEYNVQHKRDRRYGFIKITREPAPRLIPVSRVRSDGARYYGPFGRTGWLGGAVHDLSLATGLRDCPGHTPIHFGDQLEIFAGGRVPRCMRAATGTCLAPCAGLCTAAEYDRRLHIARAFLEARSRALLEELARAVREAVSMLRFEYAATLRDRMETLEKLWDHLSGFRGQVEKLNLVYPVAGHGGDDRIYLIRRGRTRAEMPWPKSDRSRRRADALVEEIFQPVPGDRDGELEADAAAEVLLTVAWFNRRPRERRRAVAPGRWLAGGEGHRRTSGGVVAPECENTCVPDLSGMCEVA